MRWQSVSGQCGLRWHVLIVRIKTKIMRTPARATIFVRGRIHLDL